MTQEIDRIKEAYRRREAEGKGRLYSLFDPAALLQNQTTERRMIRALKRRGIDSLAEKRILDVGCGRARVLQRMIDLGAAPELLVGVDLREEVIAEAKRVNPGLDLRTANAEALPFGDAEFDLVLQFTVFTSILDDGMRSVVAAEMTRVLKPGGLILWFDFRYDNPQNPDVRAVKKSDLRQLFPGFDIVLERVVLAPPIARPLARVSYGMAGLLGSVPWLCTHYLGTLRAPAHG